LSIFGAGGVSWHRQTAKIVRIEKKMCFIYLSEYLCRLSGKSWVLVEDASGRKFLHISWDCQFLSLNSAGRSPLPAARPHNPQIPLNEQKATFGL
jgi:hypothetical protein